MSLMFKEKRAKELLLKILEDLNRRFDLALCTCRENFLGYEYLWIMNRKYFENGEVISTGVKLLGIRDKKPTYAKLFNKLVEHPITGPAFGKRITIDIEQTYGSSYEEIMMNLDLNGIE